MKSNNPTIQQSNNFLLLNKRFKAKKIKQHFIVPLMIVLILLSSKTFSQLYTNGYTTITGSNAGIGTNTPTARLQLYSPPATPAGTPHLKLTTELSGAPPLYTPLISDWTLNGTPGELKFSYYYSPSYPTTQLFGINTNYVKVSAPSFIVNSNFKIDSVGNVGIGTLTPDARLHLPTGILHLGSGAINIGSSTLTSSVRLQVSSGDVSLINSSVKADYGSICLGTSPITGGVKFQVENGNIKLINGKLIIGNVTTTPGTYSIYAKDGILTEKIKVAVGSTSDWSDFVFNKNYALLPISQLKSFVLCNKHLPDMPSADEVVCDGIDLARMDASLLQKIEELTLYMFQLHQNNEDLQKQIELLKLQISNLSK